MIQNYEFSRPGEAIPRKKMLPFGHFLKGGGIQSESKSFEVVFGGLSFKHYVGEHIPKVLSSI